METKSTTLKKSQRILRTTSLKEISEVQEFREESPNDVKQWETTEETRMKPEQKHHGPSHVEQS